MVWLLKEKMSLIDLVAVSKELKEMMVGGIISNIYQIGNIIIFKIYTKSMVSPRRESNSSPSVVAWCR